jgi:phosphohistidine swiveling domain-containing protein
MTKDELAGGVLHGVPASRGLAKGMTLNVCDLSGQVVAPTDGQIILLCGALTRELCFSLPPNTSGVVAEAGGVGSHGASILRERGIPCVVGIKGSLINIPSGIAASVDGDRGRLFLNVQSGLENELEQDGLESCTCIDDGVDVDSQESMPSVPQDLQLGIVQTACYRPERSYQRLRFDMLRPGWEQSPSHLFGLDNCSLERSDDGIVHVWNGPNLGDLRRFFLSNPDWFMRASRARLRALSSIPQRL